MEVANQLILLGDALARLLKRVRGWRRSRTADPQSAPPS